VTALFVLIPLALVLLAFAVWAFVWAVDHDQFEDLDREGARVLFDDDVESPDDPEEPT
jgi:cbb3-type cytochrome oxidase maturation protein